MNLKLVRQSLLVMKKVSKFKTNDQEQQLEANTAVWAAGVRGSQLMEESFEGVKRGRIVTKQDLTIDGHDDIFVIGDVSAFIPAGEERPLPTTAQMLCNKVRMLLKILKIS